MRVGTADRQAAMDSLADHFAQGRLDPDEFGERSAAAYAARTAGELEDLFRDLPSGHPSPIPLPGPVAGPTTAPSPHGAALLHPAPYGIEPTTGIPYSDRQKAVAGLLQLLLPCGLGRLYSGQVGIGLAQLVTSFFAVGVLWAFVDGIVMLAGRPVDQHGRPLR